MIRRSAAGTFVPQALWAHEPRHGIVVQLILILAVLLAIGWLAGNLVQNLQHIGVEIGYGFLLEPAGYDISQTPIHYEATDPHWRAGLAGLINTLLVSACGIFLATLVGFVGGVLRLSSNWLVHRLMAAYIELTRNVPVLLHILLWYGLIIHSLPHPRNAIPLMEGVYLSNRGFYVPAPLLEPGIGAAVAAGLAGAACAWLYARRGRASPDVAGARSRTAGAVALSGLVVFLAALVVIDPVAFEMPGFEGFNFQGGLAVKPEFAALWLGLSLYTGAFIAENVRGGIESVDPGQTDAARALGLRGAVVMRLVVIPQAMRVIVPPLISQYLNLIKNSSLAIAVGYMDLVATIGGISLNQTGRALECMSIVLGIYLLVSLAVSGLMNLYNRRTALVAH